MKTSKNKKHITILIAIILLIVVAIIMGVLFMQFNKSNKSNTGKNSGNYQQSASANPGDLNPVYRQVTIEDYNNLEEILANNEMIQKLPEDATLLLAFYNFDSGKREWEKTYILTRGNVEEGTTEEYEIKLIMHSKYLTILNKDNLCDVVKTAKSNQNFGSETQLSSLSLAWKFKSMLKYKSCLGI